MLAKKDTSHIGVGYKDEIRVKVTAESIELFAKVSGDHNPIHLDEEYAKTTRFGRRIAHGMLSAGYISRALTEVLGGEGIYLSQTLKFVNPVFVGDELIIKIEVTGIRRDKKTITNVSTNVVKSSGEAVVKGEAIIMLDTSPEIN